MYTMQGRLSTEAQAGLAIGYQAFFIFLAVGFGLGSGLSALVSNAKGAKDTSGTRKLAAQGLSFGVIVTAIFMVVALWLGPKLIEIVSEPGGYRDAGTGYFHWLIVALPGFMLGLRWQRNFASAWRLPFIAARLDGGVLCQRHFEPAVDVWHPWRVGRHGV